MAATLRSGQQFVLRCSHPWNDSDNFNNPVAPFYQWLIVHIPWFAKLSDEQLAEPADYPEDYHEDD